MRKARLSTYGVYINAQQVSNSWSRVSTFEEMPHDRDNRDYEKYMNQATNYRKDKKPQCPENNQYQRYGEKHFRSVKIVSFRFLHRRKPCASRAFSGISALVFPRRAQDQHTRQPPARPCRGTPCTNRPIVGLADHRDVRSRLLR